VDSEEVFPSIEDANLTIIDFIDKEGMMKQPVDLMNSLALSCVRSPAVLKKPLPPSGTFLPVYSPLPDGAKANALPTLAIRPPSSADEKAACNVPAASNDIAAANVAASGHVAEDTARAAGRAVASDGVGADTATATAAAVESDGVGDDTAASQSGGNKGRGNTIDNFQRRFFLPAGRANP
jgi:hypothetical protein